MLMPKHESTEPLVRSLTEEDAHHYRKYDIDVRYYIEQTSGTKATILVVDRKHSLIMELRDDSKTTFDEAVGFSTYSDSRPGVLSYVSIYTCYQGYSDAYNHFCGNHAHSVKSFCD